MSQSQNDFNAQHFNLRFRGFDVQEVNAFLEAIAKDFLKLRQENKKLSEQLETLGKNNEELNGKISSLQENSDEYLRQQRELQSAKELLGKDLERLISEKNILKVKLQALEKENKDYLSQEKTLRNAILSAQQIADDIIAKSQQEGDALMVKTRQHVKELEESADKLKAGSRMQADKLLANAHEKIRKLQEGAQEIKLRSQQEADELLTRSRNEVKTMRQEAEMQLAAVWEEIEELKGLKAKMRRELKVFFQEYLQQLQDSPAPETTEAPDVGAGKEESLAAVDKDDLSDLFQKIDVPIEQEPGLPDEALGEEELSHAVRSAEHNPASVVSPQQEAAEPQPCGNTVPGPVRRFAIHFGRSLGKPGEAAFNEKEEIIQEKKMP